MKTLVMLFLLLSSVSSFAELSPSCVDLQFAEGAMVNLAFLQGEPFEARKFCFFLSRGIAKSKSLRKLTVSGTEYCTKGKNVSLRFLSREITAALETIPECYSEKGP